MPELAAEMPVDVTAEYVGQYGVKEGETAKAWRIALNKLAKWEDGTPSPLMTMCTLCSSCSTRRC